MAFILQFYISMLKQSLVIISLITFSLAAHADQAFNSLVNSAAQSQCAQLVIEAHDKNVNSKQTTKPLFNNPKADSQITEEMNLLAMDIKANPQLADSRYETLVTNVLKAAKKADPFFHKRCIRHYASIYKSCSAAGGKAAMCVAKQKSMRRGALKTLWAHIKGQNRINIASRN